MLNEKLMAANTSERRYVIHQGGTGSGKTYAILQYLLSYAELNQGSLISVVSETLPHLKRGAIRDMKRIIHEIYEGAEIIENKSDHYFKIGASIIEFFSADSAAKLRGARRDILFINECNNVDYESFQQLDVRTRKQTILDFNPVRRFWVHDDLLPLLAEKDFTFIKSTYRDNPYLTDEEKANIERRKGNANWWKVYGEGEVGIAEGLVFNNWEVAPPPPEGGAVYGIDFGFTHSPTAIVQVNEFNGELYVKELLYKTNMHNDEIFAFASAHLDLNAMAIADSAEPKTIDYLFQKGWRGIKAAVKGRDSVEFGINLLLDRKINVTPDSLNLIKELREYMWDTNHKGQFIHSPVKEHDHAIDALRYVVSYPKKRPLLFA